MLGTCEFRLFSPFLSPQKSSGRSQYRELYVTSVFPTPSKELLKVSASSSAPAVGPVVAADLQLQVRHEDTALVFSDFSTVCDVPWQAHGACGVPGHSLQMSSHGRYQANTNLADFESLLPAGSTSKSCLQGSCSYRPDLYMLCVCSRYRRGNGCARLSRRHLSQTLGAAEETLQRQRGLMIKSITALFTLIVMRASGSPRHAILRALLGQRRAPGCRTAAGGSNCAGWERGSATANVFGTRVFTLQNSVGCIQTKREIKPPFQDESRAGNRNQLR